MRNHRITAVAAAALAVGLVGVATTMGTATAKDEPDGAPPQSSAPALAAAVDAPVVCDGGASLQLKTRLSPVPFSFAGTSNSFINVPGAHVTLLGPQTGTDTLLITFSAETYYTGTGWMGLQVTKDGVPIHPFANNGSPLAFHSSADYDSNSAQFCTKIKKGAHIIAVKTSTTGGATENAWLDDWTLSVQRFN